MAEGKQQDNSKAKLIDFGATGPRNTAPAEDEGSKRVCMACLVNAAYISELRRHAGDSEGAVAPTPWHEAFDYRLHRMLMSPSDGSYFGAVYTWSRRTALWSSGRLSIARPASRPAVVVAMRGTIISASNAVSDLRDDLKLMLQHPHKISRLEVALRAVRDAIRRFGGPGNVCLAAHSLGAAIALQIGRLLSEEGVYIQVYAFNPPFFSLLSLRDQNLGVLVHRIRFVVAGLLSKDGQSSTTEDGDVGASWSPNLFVNVHDPVSCNYVHYFRARREDTAHRSVVASVLRLMGKKPQPFHLLRSAHLFANREGPPEFTYAHGLYQWWREDTVVEHQHYCLDRRKLDQIVDDLNAISAGSTKS